MKKEEKKVKEIGVEVSSGAEKVEKIEKSKKVKTPQKAEEERAQKRVETALKKKEEKEEKQRARAHAKAEKNHEKERKQKEKSQKKRRVEGYGGWLAAVVALSFSTLTLGAIVTVGAVDMLKTKQGVTSAFRGVAYEFVGAIDDLNDDLDRVRISASSTQQSRILTDVLVQARVAETDLEKLPIDGRLDSNLTAFINGVAKECERMLGKLRAGENLNSKDEKSLEYLYSVSAGVRAELDGYLGKMTDKELSGYMKNGVGEMKNMLERLENATLPENAENLLKGSQNAEISPEETGKKKIQPSKAEDLCKSYFADYNIGEFQCVGETVGKGYTAYNLQGYDPNGVLLFAEVDGKTGQLIRFNYYEECSEDNFSIANAKDIAENFIIQLGYEDMTAVKVRENGTDADFTFVYETDGVAYYPDAVKVKVCRTRGKVSAFDSVAYQKHHRMREKATFGVSLTDAKAKLKQELTVESERAVVVNTPKGERSAYEFVCSYGEEKYVLYLSGQTGEEFAIVNIRNLK